MSMKESGMVFPRESGVLLHPTSLPGRFGIGDLGDEAYRFVDFLAGARQHLWQMLPLGPLGFGNSPYQSLSAFAGNPLLISPARLVEDGLLDRSDLDRVPDFPVDMVDFDAVASFKGRLLRRSYGLFNARSDAGLLSRFEGFCSTHAAWLDDFALFMAVKEANGLAPWYAWEPDIRLRQPEAVQRWGSLLSQEVRRHKYLQFLFYEQWSRLKSYCAERGVRLIGDIPIFVSLDADSTWSHPGMFSLDDKGRPTVVAGVPPDYFSETGQLWNNPLYRWDAMAADGYRWWIERFKATLSLVDVVRVDHFRGFAKYWEIPGGSKTAAAGLWVEGPGASLFLKVIESLGQVPIIAEDLGIITSDVVELRDRFGFPGMRVLQFAFLSGQPGDLHLPHNYPRNCVVYTGTHDNDTTVGWFRGGGANTVPEDVRRRERERALRYAGGDGREINWDMIRLALMSVANTAIVPLQDILGLGGEARMNTPGTERGNWLWRFRAEMLKGGVGERLSGMVEMYGRG
jgi:4-alpha-glucanotransferase